MLKKNTSDSYPGANYVAADPVTEAECCLLRSVAAIAAAADAGAYPYAVRMGMIFVDIDDASKLNACQGLEPVVTLVEPDPLIEEGGGTVTGTEFGLPQGVLWITDNVAWGAEAVQVEQVAGPWTDTSIDFTVASDELPTSPAKAWLYVQNACGRVNLVGFEVTLEAPA